MYRIVRLRYFGGTAPPAKGKAAEPKAPTVIKIDFPLPKGMVGAESRFNLCPTKFSDMAPLLHKAVRPALVGGILRNEELQRNHGEYLGKVVTVAGWVKTNRKGAGGTILFVEINDGSHAKNVQVVVGSGSAHFAEAKRANTAFCVRATGLLAKSEGGSQLFEVKLDDAPQHAFKVLGDCDNHRYPFPPKYHKPETLREHAHLRARTNYIAAVARVKNNLAFATHQFYQANGFFYVKTPIITSSDCEGAGQMFQVTTLLPESGDALQVKTEAGKIDYDQDFFKRQAFLTVSGQLAVETYACSMSSVYTFGPTFRAEVSHTPRHLSEFWMIEPELSFADLFDVVDCAEAYIRFCLEYVLANNKADLEYFQNNAKTRAGLIPYLQSLIKEPFARCSYTQAVEILQECEKRGVEFEHKVEWGIDFNSDHEKYLCGVVFARPTVVYNYPAAIKSFYMRVNEDCPAGRTTVASFDILAPDVGEIVGGSQREERLEVLEARMKALGMRPEPYWWYLDLRRYGTVPHGGFGLGFERLVMMCTGVDNIRDIVPFPRYPGNA